MFYSAFAFNQPIGAWNTANVTTMENLFYSAFAFNQPIGAWNTSNVTDMASMFYSASVFNQNISSWNVASVIIKPPTNFSTNSALSFGNSPVWS
jgi:surface protein